MELDEIFNHYTEKMTQIYLYQRAMKALAQKELEKLHEFGEAVKDNPKYKDRPSSIHNMSFRRAIDGKNVFFGQSLMSIDERKRSVVLHKNKQYQWLLAEAYEEFEDCLEGLWAYVGFKNTENWPLQDFGNIRLAELSGKDFEWFQRKAAKKKGAPSSIVNTFRREFPEIQNIEKKNKLGVDLYLAITLIEKVRHVVVHKGGVVEDKDGFFRSVLEGCGLFNSGNPETKNKDFVEVVFGGGQYSNHIILLEIPTDPEILLDTHINQFDVMGGYMMAYIDVVIGVLRSHNK